MRMRILIVSASYPPVALGGYELECATVVERLRETHDVLVLSSDSRGESISGEVGVRRELELLSPDWHGAVRAPRAALEGVAAARRALAFSPELIYVWNGSSIPHAALRVLADSGLPLAFRVCEHWFGGLFTRDQFMRELLPASRAPARGTWALGCRALNRLPSLRLQALAPFRAAISWNSEALRAAVTVPAFIEVSLEQVGHPAPRYGDLYAQVVRAPAPEPEILFLGRVTPYKGVAVAIEALALLRSQEDISASLVVIGPEDPGHGAELRRLAERRGVAQAIRWRGPQTPEAIADALARAHALIVPSTWDEPFGLVMIEGALARVPLIASDVGGIGEGMREEEHALYFPPGDARAAAAALSHALESGEQTAARVLRARERAEDFRLGPYLDAQERFVAETLAV